MTAPDETTFTCTDCGYTKTSISRYDPDFHFECSRCEEIFCNNCIGEVLTNAVHCSECSEEVI